MTKKRDQRDRRKRRRERILGIKFKKKPWKDRTLKTSELAKLPELPPNKEPIVVFIVDGTFGGLQGRVYGKLNEPINGHEIYLVQIGRATAGAFAKDTFRPWPEDLALLKKEHFGVARKEAADGN